MIKRQAIINAIVERMQGIKLDQAYYSDYGHQVYTWKRTPVQKEKQICMNIEDPSQEPVQETASNYHYTDWLLNVNIFLISKDNHLSREALRAYMADVYKAIGQDRTWGGLALTTFPAGDVMEVMQEETLIADAMIRIQIQYRTQTWAEE